MKFNEKLIFVRAKLNLTQTQIAKMLGVSFATINRWENEKTTPSKMDVEKFEIFCREKKIVFPE